MKLGFLFKATTKRDLFSHLYHGLKTAQSRKMLHNTSILERSDQQIQPASDNRTS